MKRNTIYTDNSNLYDADQAVKSFIKDHGNNLNDEERNELGELLNERASAISEVLCFKVSSIANLD